MTVAVPLAASPAGPETFPVSAVAADGAPAIPREIVVPPPDLPSTGEAGPIGPLAVVFGAGRTADTASGLRSGLVGVSAMTGEYRFVDLPGRAYAEHGGVTFVELSPRGRRIAYRIGTPDRVDGFASLDTVTGQVDVRRIPSRFGLSARVVTWVSERTVLLRYAKTQRSGDGGLEPGRTTYVRWTPGGPFRRVGRPAATVVRWQRYGVLNTEVSPGGTRAAGHLGAGPQLHLVVADSLRPPVRPRRLRVGMPVWLILRWADERHLLVRAGRRPDRVGVHRVDVVTGETELLVREDVGRTSPPPRYASELWAAPTVERPTPDPAGAGERVADGRTWVVAALTGTGLLLGIALGRRRFQRSSRSAASTARS